MKVLAQLAFDGDCRPAFEFYAQALGGEIAVMNAQGDTRDVPLPPGSRPSSPDHIRFAELRARDWSLLGNDVPHDEFEPMRGFNIALHADSVADAKRVFGALSEGGTVKTPLTAVAWSPAFGQVVDRFGVPWLVLASVE